VVLDERGDAWSSRELAAKLKAWEDGARTPCFIVGGAFGLSDEVRERARANGALFSLGRITLPHELARVVLLEQLYRAASINKGLPYHHD
jgi:23S rRNA (pseudouridine1915-N3)-methyltransferase